MDSNNWYNSIPIGSLVCIQTTNMKDPDFPWFIRQTTDSLDELVDRFKLGNLLYSGVETIPYDTSNYKRYMIIGTK